jgi:hypothetical protein
MRRVTGTKPRCLPALPGPGSGSSGWSPAVTFSSSWHVRMSVGLFLDPMPALCPGRLVPAGGTCPPFWSAGPSARIGYTPPPPPPPPACLVLCHLPAVRAGGICFRHRFSCWWHLFIFCCGCLGACRSGRCIAYTPLLAGGVCSPLCGCGAGTCRTTPLPHCLSCVLGLACACRWYPSTLPGWWGCCLLVARRTPPPLHPHLPMVLLSRVFLAGSAVVWLGQQWCGLVLVRLALGWISVGSCCIGLGLGVPLSSRHADWLWICLFEPLPTCYGLVSPLASSQFAGSGLAWPLLS